MSDHTCPKCGESLGKPDETEAAMLKALEAMPMNLADQYIGVRLMRNGIVGQLHAHHVLKTTS